MEWCMMLLVCISLQAPNMFVSSRKLTEHLVVHVDDDTNSQSNQDDFTNTMLYPLNNETLSALFNRSISTTNTSDLMLIAKTLYPNLFKTKESLDWQPGYIRECFDGFGCCWVKNTTYNTQKPPVQVSRFRTSIRRRPEREPRSKCIQDGKQSDGDICCSANRAWITPDELSQGGTTFDVIQFDPDFYQGYYGVVQCRKEYCVGKCKQGSTSVSFLVLDTDNVLQMVSFEVPTYCVCTDGS